MLENTPPWALSVVNGLCLRSERLVLAVSALTGECLKQHFYQFGVHDTDETN